MAVPAIRLEEATRGQLVERVRELERLVASGEEIQQLVEELHTYQEEIRVQNEQLLDTQHDLETSRDRYADLFAFAPIPFTALDESGLILDINLAACRLLDRERSRLVGLPLAVHLVEPSRRRFLSHLASVRRDDCVDPFELELETRRGVVPVELVLKRCKTATPGTLAFHAAFQDLRERRRAEAERLQAAIERNRLSQEEAAARAASEAKDRFMAMLSHELRTPLTPVMLTLDTLERDSGNVELRRRSLQTIRRNLTIETRLIDDLLDLTRIERGLLRLEREPLDLHDAVRHAVEMCGPEIEAHGLVLDLRLAAPEAFVDGDWTRLRQVFWNLLRNAVHHTPRGGSLRVSTEDDPAAGVVRVEVRDSGRGLAPQDLERVFQPFQQGTQIPVPGGLGLGLAICSGFIEGHGGAIRAASEGYGRGTAFTVELPRSARPASSKAPQGETPQRARRGLRVLLVEDHHDTAEALGHLLRLHGYEVELAHSVGEARRATRPFDVLLSDVQLPDGSGLDLMPELAGPAGAVGIAMSGFGTAEDVERSRKAGFGAHLVKPVGIDEVVRAIEATVPGVGPPQPSGARVRKARR